MAEEMIAVSGIAKTFFTGGEPSRVLDDISFTIQKGEIVTLLGKSGCGKSTLLHMVGGFTKADQGQVLLDGRQVHHPTKRCVMLFQQCNLLPRRTVSKNVELGLEGEKLWAEAVQAAMLHHGSAAYLNTSAPARKLREAYFYANLTPTIKHLEKVLCS